MIPSRPIDGAVHPLLSLHLRLQFLFLTFVPLLIPFFFSFASAATVFLFSPTTLSPAD